MPIAASVDALARWYLGSQDVAPVRLTMGHQLADDGTPEWTAEFKRWLGDPFVVVVAATDEACEHPAKAPGAPCPRCSVFGEDGAPIGETGLYRQTRPVYWYPMRAAIARIARNRVPDGFPSLGVALMCLVNAGSVARAVVALSDQYPMLDNERAGRHLRVALERVRAAYADAPVPRRSRAPRPGKSDSQANAEALDEYDNR